MARVHWVARKQRVRIILGKNWKLPEDLISSGSDTDAVTGFNRYYDGHQDMPVRNIHDNCSTSGTTILSYTQSVWSKEVLLL